MMDALFEGLANRLRTSGRLADSTLLQIVHSAMLDAHNKTVSEETQGWVRLHHNARFHELSIIMLECCLKIVREEADDSFSDQRYEFEQALASLLEQQAVMQKKLQDLETIIAEKDTDNSIGRYRNDIKLEIPFEMIGNEVNEAVKEYNNNAITRSRMLNMERNDHGMIDKLKSSIEQDLSKIGMKLENERDTLTGNSQKLKQVSVDGVIDLENDGIDQLHGLYNITSLMIVFEELISDVGILKKDIKSSFTMMENLKSLFTTNLEENQLRMDMEQEMSNLLMKSFIQEAQCNVSKLLSIGVTPAVEATKLQSTEENPEEAASISEDINKVVISSMINEWSDEMESIVIYRSLIEDINSVLFSDIIRDKTELCSSSTTAALSKERDKGVVTSMTNDWINNRQVIEIEHSLKEDINRFIYSETMKDLVIHISPTPTTSCNKEVAKETINKQVLKETYTTSSKLVENFVDVETMISSRTNANNKRLEDLSEHLNILKEDIILLKKKELLYRNAFGRRCYDLQIAETEVDLLGDEVEFLLGLINKSYEVLERHIPELQHNCEVMEMVKILKNEAEAEWLQ